MRLIVLRIWNSGDVAIRPDDFVEPITINFGENEILDAQIVEITPKNITSSKESLIQKSESVELKPLLLNSKDSIELKVLLNGSARDIKVRARIVGVEKITERNITTLYQKYTNIPVGWLFALLLLTIALVFLVNTATSAIATQGILFIVTIYLVLAIVSIAFLSILISQVAPFLNSLFRDAKVSKKDSIKK